MRAGQGGYSTLTGPCFVYCVQPGSLLHSRGGEGGCFMFTSCRGGGGVDQNKICSHVIYDLSKYYQQLGIDTDLLYQG